MNKNSILHWCYTDAMVHQFVSTKFKQYAACMYYKGLLLEMEPSPRDLRRSAAQTLAPELLSISLQWPDPRWEAILPSDSTFADDFTENQQINVLNM